jgi:hypothetical protein
MALPWVETEEFQNDSKFLDRGHPLPPSFFESRSFRALDGLLFKFWFNRTSKIGAVEGVRVERDLCICFIVREFLLEAKKERSKLHRAEKEDD